jgi:phosphonate transport system ATP-binding protein
VSSPESDDAFSLHEVTVQFGALKALDGVTLRIGRCERVGIVGPSGGGKTTLLRVLNGMQQASTGTVTTLGQEVAALAPAPLRALRARIAFVHQNLALIPGLRVIQNVVMGRAGRRSLWRSVRDVLFASTPDTREIHALLERTGIPEKLYHRTGHLSGGQQQRVAVARALFQNPEVLLADEPVSSIDPARARDTVDLLTRLSCEDGLTLVMSLHNLELAREFFPRLIGLRHGRVVFDQPSASLSGAEFAALYRLTKDELLADA